MKPGDTVYLRAKVAYFDTSGMLITAGAAAIQPVTRDGQEASAATYYVDQELLITADQMRSVIMEQALTELRKKGHRV